MQPDPLFFVTEAIFGEGYLFYITLKMTEGLEPEQDEDANKELLKKITSPFTKKIIQV